MSVLEAFGVVWIALLLAAGVVLRVELRAAENTMTPGRTIALALLLIFVPPLGLLAAGAARVWQGIRRRRGVRGEAVALRAGGGDIQGNHQSHVDQERNARDRAPHEHAVAHTLHPPATPRQEPARG